MIDTLYAQHPTVNRDYSKKNNVPDRPSEEEKLDTLVHGGKRIFARIQTVFPFRLFPITIVVDQNKIDIIRSRFLLSHSVYTVLLRDIATVKISNDLFFATLEFEVVGYEQNPRPVRFLPKKQAYEMQRTIVGLMMAIRENIALDKMPSRKVKARVREIGMTEEKEIDQTYANVPRAE